jgi:hypothetical protein
VCIGIFTGRPVSTRRDRAVHREDGFNLATPSCAPGGPAQGPVCTCS